MYWTALSEIIVKLNDQVIENVEVFRYLGNDIRFDQPSTGPYLHEKIQEIRWSRFLENRLTN